MIICFFFVSRLQLTRRWVNAIKLNKTEPIELGNLWLTTWIAGVMASNMFNRFGFRVDQIWWRTGAKLVVTAGDSSVRNVKNSNTKGKRQPLDLAPDGAIKFLYRVRRERHQFWFLVQISRRLFQLQSEPTEAWLNYPSVTSASTWTSAIQSSTTTLKPISSLADCPRCRQLLDNQQTWESSQADLNRVQPKLGLISSWLVQLNDHSGSWLVN